MPSLREREALNVFPVYGWDQVRVSMPYGYLGAFPPFSIGVTGMTPCVKSIRHARINRFKKGELKA